MEAGFLVAGRYRLERRACSGGVTQAWRARDETLARRVTIKLIESGPVAGGFRDEAMAVAGLEHPNIVTVYDYGETGGPAGKAVPYLVMEYLGGETLADRIERGRLPVGEAVEVCAQIAEALAAAHAAGVVHKGLRPGTVHLAEDGIRLVGFGVPPAPAEPPAWSAETAATAPLSAASPYLAPEQVGAGSAAPAADVHALGVILAECLTGTTTPGTALPDGTPEQVAALSARCRAADPADRPSAGEAADMLGAAVDAPGFVGLACPGPGPRSERRRSRRLNYVLLGGAAGLAVALAMVPLMVVGGTLRQVDAPSQAAGLPVVPAAPQRSDPPPVVAPMDREPAPRTSIRREARAVPVEALSRMRRSIDEGIAANEISPRLGDQLATAVTTLLNQVDGGHPVNLRRRVAEIRAAIVARTPEGLSRIRARELTAILDDAIA